MIEDIPTDILREASQAITHMHEFPRKFNFFSLIREINVDTMPGVGTIVTIEASTGRKYTFRPAQGSNAVQIAIRDELNRRYEINSYESILDNYLSKPVQD